jgi:hypothetical protein
MYVVSPMLNAPRDGWDDLEFASAMLAGTTAVVVVVCVLVMLLI